MRGDDQDVSMLQEKVARLEARVQELVAAMIKVKAAADTAEYAWQIGEENRFTSTGWCTKLAALKEVADDALEGKPRGG